MEPKKSLWYFGSELKSRNYAAVSFWRHIGRYNFERGVENIDVEYYEKLTLALTTSGEAAMSILDVMVIVKMR